jgi:hypothetical protein
VGKGKSVARKRNVTASRSAADMASRSLVTCRRLRDRARVRRRATTSWLLRRKQRSAYNTLLKELHTEDPNEFRNYQFRLEHLQWPTLRPVVTINVFFVKENLCFCFVNIISLFQNSILIGWFPSKSIKVWRKIGWSSIPSKLVKVFDQRFK